MEVVDLKQTRSKLICEPDIEAVVFLVAIAQVPVIVDPATQAWAQLSGQANDRTAPILVRHKTIDGEA